MLIVHDLAEARTGDLLTNDPEVELEVLWQYGAFATYSGVGDLWRIPLAFREFAFGTSIDARIARDIDKLHFLLKSRTLSPGLSESERQQCERTVEEIKTVTVSTLCRRLAGFPASPRFVQPAVEY